VLVARVNVAHFGLPFRYEDGRAAVNEQGSPEDIAACVEAVLRTEPGERIERPDFGLPDPTFSSLPLDLGDLIAAVSRWEPRARVLAEQYPDLLDEAVARVRLTLRTED
jgi:phage baseplate assembly protein W